MIYLLRTSGINEKHEPVLILKIGYTDDSRGEGRFADYKSAGMDIEVLYKVRGGNIELEHELQKRFHNFNLSWKSLEWFEDCPEIVNAFSGFSDIDNIANFLDYSSFDEFIESRKKINLKELYTESLNAVISDFGEDSSIVEFYRSFIDEARFDRRLECLCNFEDREKLIDYIPDESFANFIRILGPERCKALKYRKSDVDREIDRLLNNQNIDITSDIISKFEIGRKYSLIEIKEYLTNLYEAKGFKSSPKATDLSKYFELRAAKLSAIVDGEKKMVRAFEILSIKDDNKGENL